jgi:hypothetical protein
MVENKKFSLNIKIVRVFRSVILEFFMSNQHVVKRKEGWAVKGEGNSRDTSHHSTQQGAIAKARTIAMNQRGELVIHDVNNKIREKNSYGNDSYPPKG